MAKRAAVLVISDLDRKAVEGWVRARATPQRLSVRARIVLLAAKGVATSQIAQILGTTRPTVLLWRQRFAAGGPAALEKDAPGRGRRPSIPAVTVQAIVRATTQTRPAGATHWSTRTMAQAHGVSNATVARIWQAHGLQPHRVRALKVSRDTRFAEKLTDVVGLCLKPPGKGR
jgi:transposase